MTEVTRKVSVIVPVYNAERWLHKCVESILGQTMQDLEVILVDDGSKDNSGKICDEYAEKDERVRVIHQPNSGVVAARDAGIKAAKGEWMAFVDADDWISADLYEEMLKVSEGVDVVYCNVKVLMPDGKEKLDQWPKVEDADEWFRSVLGDKLPGWLVYKIYRKDFWNSCNIRVPKNLRIMEDTVMMVQLFYNSPLVRQCVKGVYVYNQRNGESATSRQGEYVHRESLSSLKVIEEFLVNKGVFDNYKNELSRSIMRNIIPLMKFKGVKYARGMSSYAHRRLRNYPLTGVSGILYWCFFNMGLVGAWMYKGYCRSK